MVESITKKDIDSFESYLRKSAPEAGPAAPQAMQSLTDSMFYSLCSGGKRFRPMLSILTAKTLGKNIETVFPVGFAVEAIHTYSLIHDDLPMMDDDDERRGKPTNHKVYGEAMALLAGDALLTESFGLLAREYRSNPQVVADVISSISIAAGWNGMVGGQSVDIQESDHEKAQWIHLIHEKKTGALIQTSVVAAAQACEAREDQQAALAEFSGLLGFAFQLADDILDWDAENPEPTSYINVHGLEETKAKLIHVSKDAMISLEKAGLTAEFFGPIVEFNLNREV